MGERFMAQGKWDGVARYLGLGIGGFGGNYCKMELGIWNGKGAGIWEGGRFWGFLEGGERGMPKSSRFRQGLIRIWKICSSHHCWLSISKHVKNANLVEWIVTRYLRWGGGGFDLYLCF